MERNVELRKLPVGYLCNVAAILDTNNDWKKVMSFIPRDPRSDHFEPKYNLEHIKLIENEARSSNRKCAEILFEEWGTSGRIRPTLAILKNIVQKAEIYRAADEIAHLLGEAPPTRPRDGPAAPIDTSISLLMQMSDHKMNGTTAQMKSENDDSNNNKSLGNKSTAQMKPASDMIKFSDGSNNMSMNIPDLSALDIKTGSNIEESKPQSQPNYQTSLPNVSVGDTNSGICSEILTDENLVEFKYVELQIITRGFAERKIYTPPGQGQEQGTLAGKVGSGGFGDVYVGYHPNYGHLAVKKARNHLHFDRRPDIAMEVFNSEVKFLSQFRHKNVVPIIGFSRDGPSLCIVCEYIPGGSLDQKLAAKILTEKQRLNILLGTAQGLRYLHTNERPVEEDRDKNPVYRLKDPDPSASKDHFVHGDVKSANILLTRDFEPKLCDFGIAKQYANTTQTFSPMGTPAYMSPDALGGTRSQKNDIYSYGIVMLEILTGLKSTVRHNGETLNIKDYVEENSPPNELSHLLDPFIDKWTKSKELYALARKCLERQRLQRPTSEEIVNKLTEIINDD